MINKVHCIKYLFVFVFVISIIIVQQTNFKRYFSIPYEISMHLTVGIFFGRLNAILETSSLSKRYCPYFFLNFAYNHGDRLLLSYHFLKYGVLILVA